MHRRILLFTVVFITALFIISQTDKLKESFERAEAALVCFWSDPGPPLPVAIPRDPRSVVKGGPHSAPFGKQMKKPKKPMGRKQVNYVKKPKRKRRSSLTPVGTVAAMQDITVSPAPTTAAAALDISTMSTPSPSPPYETPLDTIPPEPTLGVLSVPPEITVTPRPLIA
jgi:hypothetical protein